MTVGMMMYYGGIVGMVIGGILLLVLSKVFAEQRQKMKSDINLND